MRDNDDHATLEPTSLEQMERQVEGGALHTHSALSQHAERLNRIEAFVYGLADAMLDDELITEEQLRDQAARVADELAEKKETLSANVVLRVDADPPPAEAKVDCAARLHVCHAVCCRLSFPLSAGEIEAGQVKWELGRPYLNRKDAAGVCVHRNGEGGCGIYGARPQVCRSYSCAEDDRIWKDFDRMILNQDWIDQNLVPERPLLIATRMDLIE